MSCATIAAATAAATAAAATEAANAANAMATAGNEEALSPTAGRAAGGGGVAQPLEVEQAEVREEEGEQDGGGREGGEPLTSGVDNSVEDPPLCVGQQDAGNDEDGVAEVDTPDNTPTHDLAVQRSTSSSSEVEAIPGVAAVSGDATTSVAAIVAPGTAPLWIRPSSLDVSGEVVQQDEGAESAGGTESGATSPETESPGLFPPGAVSESGSVGNGGDGEAVVSATHRPPSSPSSSGSVADAQLALAERSANSASKEATAKIDEPRGTESPDSAEGAGEGREKEGERSSLHSSGRSGADALGDSGRCAAAAAEAVKTPASPSASLAATVGESSSLRFNQMVQSFSAGLRESRRARRTPLLGSLDDDHDHDPGGFANLGDDDGGGGTYGTGTNDGDSRHDRHDTAATSARERSATWSTRSVSIRPVVGGSNCCSLHGPPTTAKDQEHRKEASTAADSSPGPEDDERCASDGVEGTAGDSADAAADAITKKAAATAVAGTSPAAEWLRILGRPDGEDAGLVEGGRDPRQAQEVRRCAEDGGGDAGGGATLTPAAASLAMGEEDPDGSVGGAAVAVALAAAERGGALSAEAAAAARRWEAKLKGSLVSMTEGVRWGLGPQRPNDVKFFKS